MHLLVGPCAFLHPDSDVPDSYVARFVCIEQLADCIADGSPISITISERTRDVAQGSASYLSFNSLRQAQARHAQLLQWPIDAISHALLAVLEEAAALETCQPCLDFAGSEMRTAPPLPLYQADPDAAEERLRALCVNVLGALCRNEEPFPLVIPDSHAAPLGEVDCVGIEAFAEPDSVDQFLAAQGRSLFGTVTVAASPAHCLAGVDPVTLLAETSTAAEYWHLLAMQVRLLRAGTNPGEATRVFDIGSEFVESLRTNGALGQGPFATAVFKKVAATLCGLNDSKPMYAIKNRKKVTRLRTRDNAVAMRSHLTTGNPALRLMSWERTDGTWELANVAPKKQESIEAGLRVAAFRRRATFFEG